MKTKRTRKAFAEVLGTERKETLAMNLRTTKQMCETAHLLDRHDEVHRLVIQHEADKPITMMKMSLKLHCSLHQRVHLDVRRRIVFTMKNQRMMKILWKSPLNGQERERVLRTQRQPLNHLLKL